VPRPTRTGKVLDFEAARRDRALTQQQAADDLGVPRTTLPGWAARAAATELPPAQRAFFESPDGVQFLRVLLTAALFVMNLSGGLGVAMVRTVFTHTGLHTLVACSESCAPALSHRVEVMREAPQGPGTRGRRCDGALAIIASTSCPLY
jgi:hypothetical protein